MAQQDVTAKERELTKDERLHFRDALRRAREAAFKDAEAFDEIIYVLEAIGCHCTEPKAGLGQYRETLNKQTQISPLAKEVAKYRPDFHLRFDELFELVRNARNGAMHEGVFARHLTEHTVELAIIMEHALMNGFNQVRHFMIRNPECAELWHPLSFIRQTMLKSSYSYLPVCIEDNGQKVWKLVSDYALAHYIGDATGTDQRKLLTQTLQTAKANGFKLLDPHTCPANTSRREALEKCNQLPILVISPDKSQLLGILTPFDLL